MYKFLFWFFILALMTLNLQSSSWAQPFIALFCLKLAQISGFIIHLFDAQVSLNAAILRHLGSGFAIEITDSCSGLSLCALYLSVVLAYPSAWRIKLYGLAVGLLLLQTLNVVRIISLVYLGAWLERSHFDIIHEQVWPLFLHLLAILLFMFWLWLSLDKSSEKIPAHAI